MSTTSSTITAKRNDTFKLRVTFTDAQGQGIDITGWTVWFTVRDKYSLSELTDVTTDTDAVIAKDWTSHTTPTQGITDLELSKEETNITPGDYAFDIQIKNTDDEIFTPLVGTFTLLPEVTRST